jgi:hypothetical protein
MNEYVTAALFVCTDDTKHLLKQLQKNASGTRITAVKFDDLMQSPQTQLEGVEHVVVAGSLDVIKETMRPAAAKPNALRNQGCKRISDDHVQSLLFDLDLDRQHVILKTQLKLLKRHKKRHEIRLCLKT